MSGFRDDGSRASQGANIGRMLAPGAVAVVGASENNPFLLSFIEKIEAAGIDLLLVHPRNDTIFGRAAVRSLADAGRPIDTVLSLVGADHVAAVVADAARVGAAGVIVTAARFGETGAEGAEKERQLCEIARAANLTICGPNCLGAFNVARSIHLYIGADRVVRPGHVALVSQSGGLFTTLQLAAGEKRIGFSHLISTGNEAVTDLADFVDFLADDPDTQVIAMVVEQVRRPAAFLAAAARARKAGKFLVALKLGRSAAGQIASASHTGALMADAREYDVAFSQAGIEVARDLDDLLGLLQLFSHYPRDKWGTADRVAVLTASGGVAALSADAFDEAGLPLPQDAALTARAAALIPGTLSANPLDITGVFYNDVGFSELLDLYLHSPAYDTIFAVNYLQDGLDSFARPIMEPMRRALQKTGKRLIAVSASETAIGPWATSLLDDGVALGAGLGSTVRSLAAMDRFLRRPPQGAANRVTPIPAPAAGDLVAAGDAMLLSFAAAARLLQQFGIPVAPHAIWTDGRPDLPDADRYVVKLADVPHRTELGAVRIGVAPADLDAVVAELRTLAAGLGVPETVVVQPMLAIERELFVGVQGQSTFGPLLMFGIGGILVEAISDVTMRVAPFGLQDAREMLGELRAGKMLGEFRGRPAVDRDALGQLLVNVGRLAAASAEWLEAIDINPIISNRDGLAAVDVAVTVRTR